MTKAPCPVTLCIDAQCRRCRTRDRRTCCAALTTTVWRRVDTMRDAVKAVLLVRPMLDRGAVLLIIVPEAMLANWLRDM